MRIAVLVMGLIFFFILLPLSCTSMVVSSCAATLSGNSQPDTIGMFGGGTFWIAILSAIAAGFVIKLPLVSIIIFSIAFICAIAIPQEFAAYRFVLGIPCLLMAVLSYFGYRELKKGKTRQIKQTTEIVSNTQQQSGKKKCGKCGFDVEEGQNYCRHCGEEL
jgi:hypothetical protein